MHNLQLLHYSIYFKFHTFGLTTLVLVSTKLITLARQRIQCLSTANTTLRLRLCVVHVRLLPSVSFLRNFSYSYVAPALATPLFAMKFVFVLI